LPCDPLVGFSPTLPRPRGALPVPPDSCQPVLRPAGSVTRPEPLRHNAFEAHLAGVPEYALAMRGAFTAPRARGELTIECQECRKEAARGQFLLDQDD
jgi:hypothetical protein